MAEDVMAQLVPGDVNDLRSGRFGDGGVEYHDALGGAETGDVGIDGGGFLAGVHPEHAFGRDILAGALNQFFQADSEFRIFFR